MPEIKSAKELLSESFLDATVTREPKAIFHPGEEYWLVRMSCKSDSREASYLLHLLNRGRGNSYHCIAKTFPETGPVIMIGPINTSGDNDRKLKSFLKRINTDEIHNAIRATQPNQTPLQKLESGRIQPASCKQEEPRKFLGEEGGNARSASRHPAAHSRHKAPSESPEDFAIRRVREARGRIAGASGPPKDSGGRR